MRRGAVLPHHVPAGAEGSGGEHGTDANGYCFPSWASEPTRPPRASEPTWPSGTPGQPQPCPCRTRGAVIDILGSVLVGGVAGFGGLTQPYQACPSRCGARFGFGNVVFWVDSRGGRYGAVVDP